MGEGSINPLDTPTPCTMVGDCGCLTRHWRKKLKILIMLHCITQISIPALTFNVHGLEFARRTVHMTLAASALINVLPIKILCALQMEQHTTTDAGMS